jgi:hypothetical protein
MLAEMRLLTAFAFVLVACDPVGEVRFKLVDLAGAPVADANVTMACPNGSAPETARSSPDGSVVIQRIPDIDPACTFKIEKAGFSTRMLPRSEAGYHTGLRDPTTSAKVVLEPTR